ncbi:MAG: GIY-YIG nuclease family protein [Amphiplicatus sp.]
MADLELDELRDELAEFAKPEKKTSRSPREERIIAGFEDVQRFVEKHGRTPQHGEERDIFERLYAVRLDRLRALEECRAILTPLDRQGLLVGAESVAPEEAIDDDELLAELDGVGGASDIRTLRHVRASADKRAAEEIAERTPCADFEKFRPLFAAAQVELDSGLREARTFQRDTEILAGQFFILGGQKAYIHDLGSEFETPEGRTNRRMRVIFDNGTEINALLRSFQRALYKPENHGRRITDPAAGPLFAASANETDAESGTIYVLRSKSNHELIANNRDIVHKIGVTGGDVKARIANAALDATYLLADVEVVATYKLYNINRARLEKLFHRFFAPARLELEIPDRFGNLVRPCEWYLVPLSVIDQAVEKVRDGTITEFRYDPSRAALTPFVKSC